LLAADIAAFCRFDPEPAIAADIFIISMLPLFQSYCHYAIHASYAAAASVKNAAQRERYACAE